MRSTFMLGTRGARLKQLGWSLVAIGLLGVACMSAWNARRTVPDDRGWATRAVATYLPWLVVSGVGAIALRVAHGTIMARQRRVAETLDRVRERLRQLLERLCNLNTNSEMTETRLVADRIDIELVVDLDTVLNECHSLPRELFSSFWSELAEVVAHARTAVGQARQASLNDDGEATWDHLGNAEELLTEAKCLIAHIDEDKLAA